MDGKTKGKRGARKPAATTTTAPPPAPVPATTKPAPTPAQTQPQSTRTSVPLSAPTSSPNNSAQPKSPNVVLLSQLPQNVKTYKDDTTQQTQNSNYAAAVNWAAQQTSMSVPRIATSPPPKEPIRPKGEKIGADEVQCVQNHIEKCLQLYMNQNEVIAALHLQANIEPGFTSLVWQRLEEQNPEFFRAYHIRLRIKEQITAFNFLASQQFQALQKANPSYFQLPQHTTVPGNFFKHETAYSMPMDHFDNSNLQEPKDDSLLGTDTSVFFDQSGQTA